MEQIRIAKVTVYFKHPNLGDQAKLMTQYRLRLTCKSKTVKRIQQDLLKLASIAGDFGSKSCILLSNIFC